MDHRHYKSQTQQLWISLPAPRVVHAHVPRSGRLRLQLHHPAFPRAPHSPHRARTRIAAEIEAAQSMQQLLLARPSQLTPGFDVQSVYLPASEVGGDFFLVSPAQDQDQSLIALIGDVSGKGLPAAMRVAMILGILRREDSREPAIILRRLNHALLSQGDVGFTTACCVRLQPDGAFTLANAGHISPYVNGTELETLPGLPLSLASDQDYTERSGHLATGSCMVLLSDDVV